MAGHHALRLTSLQLNRSRQTFDTPQDHFRVQGVTTPEVFLHEYRLVV
jgi:hypothetical protein